MPASPKFTATRTTHGKATRITIRDAKGDVIDTTESKTMRYVEVRIAKDGGILARSQSPGGTADAARRHPGSMALVVVDAEPEYAPATLHADREAQAKVEQGIRGILAGTTTADAVLASVASVASVAAPKAPKAAVKAEPAAIDPAAVMPEGATLVAAPSGSYSRVMVNGKSIGYISSRKGGALLAEILTSRLDEATKEDMKGTRARQNQTALIVNDDATRAQAARLFAVAAATTA